MPRRERLCTAPGTIEGLNLHRQRHETTCEECRGIKLPGLPDDRLRKRARRVAIQRMIDRFPDLWALFYAVEKAKALAAIGQDSGLDWAALNKLLVAASGGHTLDCEPEKGPDYCVGHAA